MEARTHARFLRGVRFSAARSGSEEERSREGVRHNLVIEAADIIVLPVTHEPTRNPSIRLAPAFACPEESAFRRKEEMCCCSSPHSCEDAYWLSNSLHVF